jgi:AcrR family transcriptional regulator
MPSVDLLIRAAGVSKSTFYELFANREELLQATGALAGERLLESLLTAMANTRSPVARWSALVTAYLHWAEREPAWAVAAELPEHKAASVSCSERALSQALLHAVRAAGADLRRPTDPDPRWLSAATAALRAYLSPMSEAESEPPGTSLAASPKSSAGGSSQAELIRGATALLVRLLH